MPKQPLLLVDMDGVICDYNERLIDSGLVQPNQLTHERWRNSNLPREVKEHLRTLVYAPGFFSSLRPVAGAVASLERLMASGWNVYVCSRPPQSSSAWSEKYDWICQYCPFLSERIILTTSKNEIKGAAFIDDSLEALQEWSGSRKILLQTNAFLSYAAIPRDVEHFTNWAELARHLQSPEARNQL